MAGLRRRRTGSDPAPAGVVLPSLEPCPTCELRIAGGAPHDCREVLRLRAAASEHRDSRPLDEVIETDIRRRLAAGEVPIREEVAVLVALRKNQRNEASEDGALVRFFALG